MHPSVVSKLEASTGRCVVENQACHTQGKVDLPCYCNGDSGVILLTRSQREGISTKNYPCQGKKESRGRLMIKLMTHVIVDAKGPASGTSQP
jgi:hypothetical protein